MTNTNHWTRSNSQVFLFSSQEKLFMFSQLEFVIPLNLKNSLSSSYKQVGNKVDMLTVLFIPTIPSLQKESSLTDSHQSTKVKTPSLTILGIKKAQKIKRRTFKNVYKKSYI